MSAAQTFPWQESHEERAETDFRSLFEHAPFPAARCDQHGVVLETNPAFELVLNGSGDGNGKKTHSGVLRVSDVLAPENGESDDNARLVREVLEGKRSAAHIDATNSRRGWTIWRDAGTGPKAAQAFLIGEPLSAMECSQIESLQSQRWEAVGRLTGGVVHDFNNLLTGVMLYCDLLLACTDACTDEAFAKKSGEHRLRRYAEEIRGALAQATAMVRRLLVFSRPKSGAIQPLSLTEVAETMHDLMSRLIGEHIRLEFRLDPGLGLVEIDWGQAEQVLLNLILNARDALPAGGRIWIETSNCRFEGLKESGAACPSAPALPCVLLAVSDNGCGMDAETRQRLFEPFFTTKTSGTGLGLATIRSIVTNHRGIIQVESQPGRGTRVMILLPQALSISTAAVSTSPVSTSPIPPPPHLAVASSDSHQTTIREVKEPQL